MIGNFAIFEESSQHKTETIPRLQWSDINLATANEDELEKISTKVIADAIPNLQSLLDEELNTVNEFENNRLLANTTIAEVVKKLPKMSPEQADKLHSYILNTSAKVRDKASYCQHLIYVAHLVATKEEPQIMDLCEAISESASNCISGGIGSLRMIQKQISGKSTDLAIYDINKWSFLVDRNAETHSQSHFLADYGDVNMDALSVQFPSSMSSEYLRSIIAKNAFLDKRLFEDYAQHKMLALILKEKERAGTGEEFTNNLYSALLNNPCPLVRKLAKDCFGEDNAMEVSSFFNATGKDLKNQVIKIVKNNTLGSVNVVINSEDKDVILKSLTFLTRGKSIPSWLKNKMEKCGGVDRLATFIPNIRYKTMLAETKNLPQPKIESLQDCIDAGLTFREISQKVRDDMPLTKHSNGRNGNGNGSNGNNTIKINVNSLIGNPDSDKILHLIVNHTIVKNEDHRMAINAPQGVNKYTIDYLGLSYAAFRYGLNESFYDKDTILQVILTAKQNPDFTSRLPISVIVSALRATENNPDARKELLLMNPILTNKLLSVKDEYIKSLEIDGVECIADLLRYTLKPIQNESEIVDILKMDYNTINHLLTNHSDAENIKSLNCIINLLSPKSLAKLAINENGKQSKLIKFVAFLMPNSFNNFFTSIVSQLSTDEIKKLATAKSLSGKTLIHDILTIAPKSFNSFFAQTFNHLGHEEKLNLLNNKRLERESLPILATNHAPSSFGDFIKTISQTLNNAEMCDIWAQEHNSGHRLATIAIVHGARYMQNEDIPDLFNTMRKNIGDEKFAELLTERTKNGNTPIMMIAKHNPDYIESIFNSITKNMSNKKIATLLTSKNDSGISFPMCVAHLSKGFFKSTIMPCMKNNIKDPKELRKEFDYQNSKGTTLRLQSGLSNQEIEEYLNRPIPQPMHQAAHQLKCVNQAYQNSASR